MEIANETPTPVVPGSEEYNTQMANLADANVNQAPIPVPEAITPVSKPDHVPDKFWDTDNGVVNYEAWAKSTNELEGKFTAKNQGTEAQADENANAESDNTVPEGAPISQESFDRYTQEFGESGELTEDSYDELLKAGIPRDYVDAYIDGQKAIAATSEANTLREGGFADRASFDQAGQWAATNLPANDIQAFNETMNSGDQVAITSAMKTLKEAFTTAKGSLGSTLLQGGGNAPITNGFASQHEVTTAMSDSRYKVDPAYRAQVMQKLSVSNF